MHEPMRKGHDLRVTNTLVRRNTAMDPVMLTIVIAFLSGIILGLIAGVKMSHSGGNYRVERTYRM